MAKIYHVSKGWHQLRGFRVALLQSPSSGRGTWRRSRSTTRFRRAWINGIASVHWHDPSSPIPVEMFVSAAHDLDRRLHRRRVSKSLRSQKMSVATTPVAGCEPDDTCTFGVQLWELRPALFCTLPNLVKKKHASARCSTHRSHVNWVYCHFLCFVHSLVTRKHQEHETPVGRWV